MCEADQPTDDVHDWPALPIPLIDVIGHPVDEVAQRYRDGNFFVQVLDLDGDTRVTLDLSPRRIRLYARNGIVEHAGHR